MRLEDGPNRWGITQIILSFGCDDDRSRHPKTHNAPSAGGGPGAISFSPTTFRRRTQLTSIKPVNRNTYYIKEIIRGPRKTRKWQKHSVEEPIRLWQNQCRIFRNKYSYGASLLPKLQFFHQPSVHYASQVSYRELNVCLEGSPAVVAYLREFRGKVAESNRNWWYTEKELTTQSNAVCWKLYSN